MVIVQAKTTLEAVDYLARGYKPAAGFTNIYVNLKKGKLDEEYIEYERQQQEFYQDQPAAPQYGGGMTLEKAAAPYNPAPAAPTYQPMTPAAPAAPAMDMDDYPDDGFGPDVFSPSYSEIGYNPNKPVAAAPIRGEEEFPDEFDTNFGGGAGSMFKDSFVKPAQPAPQQPQRAPQPAQAAPQPIQKPAPAPAEQKSKNADALNSFFNF